MSSPFDKFTGSPMKVFACRSILEVPRNFFSNHVMRQWNSLPHSIIEAKTVNAFKSSLDKVNMEANYSHGLYDNSLSAKL